MHLTGTRARFAAITVVLAALSGCAAFEEFGRRAADAAAETVREDLMRILGESAEGAISAAMRGDSGGALAIAISGLAALGVAFVSNWRGRSVGERKGRAYERNDFIAEKVLATLPDRGPK